MKSSIPTTRPPANRGRPGLSRAAKIISVLLFSVLGSLSSTIFAQVVITNLPNTTNGGSSVSNTVWKAFLFTTGSTESQISAITLGLNPRTGPTPTTETVAISLYSMSDGAPTTLIASTGSGSVSMTTLQQTYSFASLPGFNLAALESYAIVLSSDNAGIKWGRSAGSLASAAGGFTYDGMLFTTDSGSTWSTPAASDNAFQLQISAVPEPSSFALLAGVATLGFVATRRRRLGSPDRSK